MRNRKVSVDLYYKWLCDLIEVNQPEKSYWLLAKFLFRKEFFWSVPNDDNRSFEGRSLREQFCDENQYEFDHNLFNFGCSMLELIIALAYRCESIMADQEDNLPMNGWFWKLISNAGLAKYTDDMYYDLDGETEIELILNRIIERTYHRSGRGGLFPLKNRGKDQRKVELWYQMSSYLVEKYYMDDEIL